MLAFSNDYYGMIFRATQSVELFCAYERVEVRVLDVNFQMLQLIKKTPFIYEGYLENRCVYKNNYIGMHYYSLLEYEFERLLKNSESDREL